MPAELAGRRLDQAAAALLPEFSRSRLRAWIDTGELTVGGQGAKPRLLPKSLHESVGTPARTLARIPDELHEMNWVEAAKGHVPVSSPFEYAAKLTEVMLLGIVSLRAGKKLVYDGANMRVTNGTGADKRGAIGFHEKE